MCIDLLVVNTLLQKCTDCKALYCHLCYKQYHFRKKNHLSVFILVSVLCDQNFYTLSFELCLTFKQSALAVSLSVYHKLIVIKVENILEDFFPTIY